MNKKYIWLIPILALFVVAAYGQEESSQESQIAYALLYAANQARSQNNLPPLTWDRSLTEAARVHSGKMANQGSLSHQFPGEQDLAVRAGAAGAHFHKIAENVAVGPSAAAIHGQWMKSPPHRANILDPQLNAIGIAVARKGGNFYATEDFSTRMESYSAEEIEARIAELLKKYRVGIDPQALSSARQACATETGAIGNPRPGFTMRWEGFDLNRLPGALEQRLSSGKYHSAAVGACNSKGNEQGFSSYRIAVLLY